MNTKETKKTKYTKTEMVRASLSVPADLYDALKQTNPLATFTKLSLEAFKHYIQLKQQKAA